jgi:predicted TIM-barrel fold metal-dependent hydrolase
MRSCGIRYAVVFPMDEADCGLSYRRTNDKIIRLVRRHRNLIGFVRLDPRAGRAALAELRRACGAGLKGVKLHPRSEDFSPGEAEFLFPEIARLRLPVIIHTSHDPKSTPRAWRPVLVRYREIPFILAHGGKDHYLEAAEIARRQPNVFIETSTLSYFRTREILAIAGASKVLFASDFPYSHPALERRKYELAASPRARRAVFEANARRLARRWRFFA